MSVYILFGGFLHKLNGVNMLLRGYSGSGGVFKYEIYIVQGALTCITLPSVGVVLTAQPQFGLAIIIQAIFCLLQIVSNSIIRIYGPNLTAIAKKCCSWRGCYIMLYA